MNEGQNIENNDSEYKRHRNVIDGMMEVGNIIRDDREELIKIIIGLQNKFGKNERVADLYNQLDEIEKKLQVVAVGVGDQIKKYPQKKSSEIKIDPYLKELDDAIEIAEVNIEQVNSIILAIAKKHKILLDKFKLINDSKIDSEIKEFRKIISELEEIRMKFKTDQILLKQEKEAADQGYKELEDN